jgi:hypothetical protein
MKDKKYQFFPQMNARAGSFPSATGAQPASNLKDSRSYFFDNKEPGA